MTNDPWLASGHLPDITMAMPIFYKDKLVAFAVQTDALTGSWEKTNTPRWTASATEFDEWGNAGVDLYPEALRDEIDAIDADVYDNVNNGVYRCGFATTQGAYEKAFHALFKTLDELEQRLANQRRGLVLATGVAGSGKTMILGYRCLHLARLLHKPILVLCYNVTLAALLLVLLGAWQAREQASAGAGGRWLVAAAVVLGAIAIVVGRAYADLPDTIEGRKKVEAEDLCDGDELTLGTLLLRIRKA